MIRPPSSILRRLVLGGALLAASAVHAGPIVNGGFETGDFTGWTQFGDDSFTGVGTGVQHSGTHGAFFGAFSPGGISQTLSTVAGLTYEVSFWLMNADAGTPNLFEFNWDGGAVELSLNDAPATGYQPYTFSLTASGTATELRFTSSHATAFYYLDDVTVSTPAVTTVPEPGSLMLAGAALAGLALASRKGRGA